MPRMEYIKAKLLSIPLLIIELLIIGDLFGNGIIFSITADNCYVRGKLNILIYVVLLMYLMESVANAYHAKKKELRRFSFLYIALSFRVWWVRFVKGAFTAYRLDGCQPRWQVCLFILSYKRWIIIWMSFRACLIVGT